MLFTRILRSFFFKVEFIYVRLTPRSGWGQVSADRKTLFSTHRYEGPDQDKKFGHLP